MHIVSWQDFQVLQLWHNRRHHSRRMAHRLQRFPQRSRLLPSPSLQHLPRWQEKGSEHTCINFLSFKVGFSAWFLLNCAGDLSEQTRYCFDIYDLNSDGYISRSLKRFESSCQYFSLLQEVLRSKLTSLTVQGGDADDAEGEEELILASRCFFLFSTANKRRFIWI